MIKQKYKMVLTYSFGSLINFYKGTLLNSTVLIERRRIYLLQNLSHI